MGFLLEVVYLNPGNQFKFAQNHTMCTKQKLSVGYIWLLISNICFRAMKTIWGENEENYTPNYKEKLGEYLEIGWTDIALMKPFYIYTA